MKKKKKEKKVLKFFKHIIVIVIIGIIAFSAYEINKGYYMYKQAIEQTSIKEKVKEIKQKENYTKLDEVPKIYINAILAVEDHRYYEHKGIDVISITRAILRDIKELKLIEGGSTITQQLAKNAYFTQEKKLERKIAEIFMANELEENLSKDEILELYLNTSYFGNGYYSVKEASRGYFNKEPIEMDEYESIMLAGIPNAPSVYAPTKNPELAKQRQKQVARAMVKYGYLTQEEVDKILKSRD